MDIIGRSYMLINLEVDGLNKLWLNEKCLISLGQQDD